MRRRPRARTTAVVLLLLLTVVGGVAAVGAVLTRDRTTWQVEVGEVRQVVDADAERVLLGTDLYDTERVLVLARADGEVLLDHALPRGRPADQLALVPDGVLTVRPAERDGADPAPAVLAVVDADGTAWERRSPRSFTVQAVAPELGTAGIAVVDDPARRRVEALDLATGETVWSRPAAGGRSTAILLRDGRVREVDVVVARRPGTRVVDLLRVADGGRTSSFDLPEQFAARDTSAGTTLVLEPGACGGPAALHREGRVTALAAPPAPAPASCLLTGVDPGLRYTYGADGRLLALDLDAERPAWREVALDEPVRSRQTPDGAAVDLSELGRIGGVVTADGRVVAFDGARGERLFTVEVGEGATTSSGSDALAVADRPGWPQTWRHGARSSDDLRRVRLLDRDGDLLGSVSVTDPVDDVRVVEDGGAIVLHAGTATMLGG